MKLLKAPPGKAYRQMHSVIGTAMNVSQHDRTTVEEQLRNTFGFPGASTLFDTGCYELLSEHKLSIVAGANF
jgi:hypothetical protein